MKPYGYEITVGVADARHVQFGGPASATLTLHHTGTEAAAQLWALKQVRKVKGRAMQVVSIDELKPLTREEYESVMRQKRGWPALPTQNREKTCDVKTVV